MVFVGYSVELKSIATFYAVSFFVLSVMSHISFNAMPFTLFRTWVISMNNILPDAHAQVSLKACNLLNVLSIMDLLALLGLLLSKYFEKLDLGSFRIGIWIVTGIYAGIMFIQSLLAVWIWLDDGVDYTVASEFAKKNKQIIWLIFITLSLAPGTLLLYALTEKIPLLSSDWLDQGTSSIFTIVGHGCYWMFCLICLINPVMDNYNVGPRGFRSKTVVMRPASIVVEPNKPRTKGRFLKV